jgi:DNA polymerase-3 subunit alpha
VGALVGGGRVVYASGVMSGDFVHLHVHTQYSTLDGALKVKDLLKKTAAMGMPAVAITDHANMFGAVQLYKYAKDFNVKPILGCEINVVRGEGRSGAPAQLDHLVLLAASEEGYKNLVKIVSAGHTHPASDGAPSVRLDKVAEHTKGLVCLTACMGGVLQQRVLEDGTEAGLVVLDRLRQMFDPGHLFVELQDHGLPEQPVVNGILADLARRLDLPLVGSNDCHFKGREDGEAQLYLQCIQMGRSFEEVRAGHHGSFEMFLKSGEEMRQALRDHPEACDNTLRVAEMCTGWKLKLGHSMLPSFPLPEGFDEPSYFCHVAREGLEQRFKEFAALKKTVDVQAYRQRLEIELGVICKMQFPGYFLIVWDFIRHAKEHGIPVGPGRGSGAGSLVAYAMRITDLDPLPFNLLFERFLNPERVSMPDFDIDFCMDKRDRVISYVAEKYGRTSVGQIATFHELKARSVIKDVARAMRFEAADAAKISALIPMKGPGATYTIPEMIEQNIEPKFTALMDTDPRVNELVQQARRLEGLTRHAGMHAAGVVISEGPLWDHVPVFVNGGVSAEGPAPDSVLVTQYYKEDVELAGLVKFDFLGLKTLTVLDVAINLVNGRPDFQGKASFDPSAVPLGDRETYELLSSGETIGIFQLESSGMQKLFQDLKPTRFEDIVAAVALYRPGPLETGMVKDFVECKHGRQPIKKMHALIDELLEPTYGVIVYQEQVMQIAQLLAGYTLGGADLLRRAMGKKKPEEMAKQKGLFVEGAIKNGVDSTEASNIFDLVEKFAGYGFNKCIWKFSTIVDAKTGNRTTIEELFRRRSACHVHAMGPDGKMQIRPVKDVVWNGVRPVFRLKTRLGKEIVATDNHPFRTLDGWTNLGDLRPGDRIAAPRQMRVATDKRWPEHELITLAGLLSEGNTCHPSCLYFFGNEPTLVNDFAAAAAQFPHSVARVYRRPGEPRMEVCVSTGRDARFKKGQRPWNAAVAFEGGAALALPEQEELPRRSGAFEWALTLGIIGKKATEKSVPAEVFTLADEDIALFLGRLWSGDGFFANRTNFVPFYATSSRRLAEDVGALLLRLGILSTLHTKLFKYRGGVRTGYTVHLLGEGVRRFVRLVAPHCVGREPQLAQLHAYLASKASGQSSIDTLPVAIGSWMETDINAAGLTREEVEHAVGGRLRGAGGGMASGRRGYPRELVARVGELVGSRRLVEAATSDVFWDEVVSIEPVGMEDVYDLEVEGDHNFVADGLIVHNSHSAAYALITYQTAYLKAHYPVEFFCALMTADKEKNEKVVRMIAEARSWEVKVLPPDINESNTDFKVVYGNPAGDYKPRGRVRIKDAYRPMIRFGLGAVRGVGEAALDAVFEARSSGGPFRDLFDFASRVDARRLNRGVLEALVFCGAFDSTFPKGVTRAQAFKALDGALDQARNASRDRERGQTNLFALLSGDDEPVTSAASYPAAPPWDLRELLKNEKGSLGFYVSGHPLDRYGKDMGRFGVVPISSLASREDWAAVKVAGMVENYKEKIPKGTKTKIAFFDLEDTSGRVSVKVRDKALAQYGDLLVRGEPLLISGKLSFPPAPEDAEEGDSTPREPTLLINEAQLLSTVICSSTRVMILRLPGDRIRREQIVQVRQVLMNHQGPCAVQIIVDVGNNAEAILTLPNRATPSDEVLGGLERIFGEKLVELH